MFTVIYHLTLEPFVIHNESTLTENHCFWGQSQSCKTKQVLAGVSLSQTGQIRSLASAKRRNWHRLFSTLQTSGTESSLEVLHLPDS